MTEQEALDSIDTLGAEAHYTRNQEEHYKKVDAFIEKFGKYPLRKQGLWDQGLTDRICDLRAGCTRVDAAKLLGLPSTQIAHQMENNPYIKILIERAETESKAWHIKNIQSHAKDDWKASSWLLTKKWRKEFGENTPQLTEAEFIKMATLLCNAACKYISLENLQDFANDAEKIVRNINHIRYEKIEPNEAVQIEYKEIS